MPEMDWTGCVLSYLYQCPGYFLYKKNKKGEPFCFGKKKEQPGGAEKKM